MIKPLLTWRNPDSTADLNTLSSLFNKGIYEGGLLTPSSANLTVSIAPFIAKTSGGLMVQSDAAEVVTLTPGQTQYLVLFAKYNSPSASNAEIQLLSSAAWSTSPQRDYFITFAKITTPALATLATSATISYLEGEYTEKYGKQSWRPSVANFAALPTAGNRKGDIRLALDTYTIYVWDSVSLTWSAYGQATDLSETSARGSMGTEWERLSLSTSGLIGSVLNDPSKHTTMPTHAGISLPLDEIGAPNQLGIGALHAYVHGEYIHQRSQTLALSAPPGVGSRYDLVFLEVYRDVIPTAYGVTYENSGATFDPLSAVIAHLESGADSALGTNYSIGAIDLVDSTTVVMTTATLRIQTGVAADTTNPATAMASATNAFANAYSQFATSDVFAYRASAPGVYSQYTYAIPLLILKRTSTEGNFVVFDAVTGERYAFDIAPSATLGTALAETPNVLTKDSADTRALGKPSGFMTAPAPIVRNTAGPGICSIDVPTMPARVLGADIVLPSDTLTFPAAAATGGRRDFAYVELQNTHSPTNVAVDVGGTTLECVTNLGARVFSWYATYKTASVGTASDLDDSFTALGFMPVPNDTALWYRPATADEPTRDGYVYALSVAVLHRRNSGAWTVGGNPNGSIGRPDFVELADPEQIHEREIVDLRRRVVRQADVDDIIGTTFSDICTANLRTRLREHPYASDVYGTSCMMTTLTSAAPVAGKHVMTPVPNAANAHTVWSDSNELIPLSYVFTNLNVVHTSADSVFSWDGGGNTGILTITAPTGMFIAGANTSIQGPYTGVTTTSSTVPQMSRSFAMQYDVTDGSFTMSPGVAGTVSVSILTSDSLGNPTSATVTGTQWGSNLAALATGALNVTVWFEKPRSDEAGAYSANGSLFGSPTRTYTATHGGSPVNVGAITATVRVLVTGTSFTITRADVFAVRPDIASASGRVKLYGVARIRGELAAPTLRYVRAQNAAGTDADTELLSIELASALPANTPVDVVVMCDGDIINQWIEIVPESRQVRGLYAYGLGATANIDANGLSGYTAIPLPRSGVAADTQRTVPMSETSIGNDHGFKSGIVSGANRGRNAGNIDFMLAAAAYSGGPAQVAGVGYIYWYDPADAAAVGVNVPENMYPGMLTVSSLTYTAGTVDSSGVLPHHGPYGPRICAGDFVDPQDQIAFLAVIQQAPTLALEVTYETPAYQGITDDATLRSRLRGTLAGMGQSLVTTEGANASLLHPAVARLPVSNFRTLYSDATPSLTFGISPCTHRDPDDIVIDMNGDVSKMTLVSDVRRRARSRVSLMRQLPYPAAPSTSVYNDYASARKMYHGVVSTRTLSRFITTRMNTVFTYIPLAATTTIGFDLPPASVLVSATVFGFTNSTGGNVDVTLNVSTDPTGVFGWTQLGFTSTAVGINSTYRIGVDTDYADTDDNAALRYQNLGCNNFYTLTVTVPDDTTVGQVVVAYRTHVDPVNVPVPSSSYYYENLHYTLLARADAANNPKSTLLDSNPGVSKLVGKLLTIPESWAPTDDNDAVTAAFVSGAVDTAGEWARGVTAVGDDGSTTFYEVGMLAYVPYSGTVLRSAHTTAISDLNLEMPPLPPVESVQVDMGAFGTAIARVTPYAIINSTRDVTVGVSVGVKDYSSFIDFHVPEGGSTIDGFYPQGRPVIEGE